MFFLVGAGIGAGFYISGLMVGKLFDNGLGNTLCLETLRHGTNFFSYCRIRCQGADPSWGGSFIGSTKGYMVDKNINGHFYVFKDSEYPHFHPPKGLNCLFNIAFFFHKWIGPRFHSFLSGYHAINHVFCLSADSNCLIIKCLRVFFGFFGGLITLCTTPTLKFRFSSIDPERFTNDNFYSNAAYKTTSKIEAWRLGILGSLVEGVNWQWGKRVIAHPLQLCLGLLQIVSAVALLVITIYCAIWTGYLSSVLFIAPFAAGALYS